MDKTIVLYVMSYQSILLIGMSPPVSFPSHKPTLRQNWKNGLCPVIQYASIIMKSMREGIRGWESEWQEPLSTYTTQETQLFQLFDYSHATHILGPILSQYRLSGDCDSSCLTIFFRRGVDKDFSHYNVLPLPINAYFQNITKQLYILLY